MAPQRQSPIPCTPRQQSKPNSTRSHRWLAALSLSTPLWLAGCALHPTPQSAPQPATSQTTPAKPLGPLKALPEHWHRGAFMQIYVRGYQDSDGDGIGDLRGLINRLDYLHDLGVRGLWLMPITVSADRDHGYAVSDYRQIERAFGTLDDFKELLHEAHARDIGVILDYVLNHSSDEHPLFVDSARPDSPVRGLYVWQATKPEGWRVFDKDPWYPSPVRAPGSGYYFGGFWSGMPEFNFRDPATVRFHHDNLKFWLDLGVDGFRFDAVGHLIENGAQAWADQADNHPVINGVRQLVTSYPRRYIVCESPGHPRAFAAANSCGEAFAFDINGEVLKAARGDTAAIHKLARYYTDAPPSMAMFLANHDAFAGARVWEQLQGDLVRYKLAAASYLLLPGTPFIYYGEEIGMGHAPGLDGDPALRAPMSWSADSQGFSSSRPFRRPAANLRNQNVASQLGQADSLHSHYKALLALRNTLPSVQRGNYQNPQVDGQLLRFERSLRETNGNTETTLVLINYGQTASNTSLPASNATWHAHFGASSSQPLAAGQSVKVAPLSAQVWSSGASRPTR